MSLVTLRQAVHHFVDDIIRQPGINSIVGEWRVEEEIIVDIIVSHFNSIGIFYVEPNLRKVLEEDVIFQLKNSKVIQAKVQKAAAEERQRKQRNAALANT